MRRQLPHVLLTTLVVCTAWSARAQNQPPPSGWKWLTDSPANVSGKPDPGPGEFSFTTMAPGWHVTSRAGAVLFDPTATAQGRFAVEAEVFLFPGTSDAGFGILVGGQDLEGAASYVAFLIRRDGSAGVEQRDREATAMLRPWARHEAIVPHGSPEKKGTTARNVLRVEAEATQVSFLVNGTKVVEVPRHGTTVDGVVGLRIGADLNLHVTNLDVTRKLALPRP